MLNVADVLQRFADYLGAETDGPICEALGVSRSSISSWRSRGSIPYRHFVEFAKRDDINLNWLFLGEGERRRPMPGDNPTHPPGPTHKPSPMQEKLRELETLASLSTNGPGWQILKLIMLDHPRPYPLAQLRSNLPEIDKLDAHLQLFVKQGLVRLDGDEVCLASEQSLLMSHTPQDTLSHAQAVIQLITERIIPAVNEDRGRMLLFEARLAPGSSHQLAEELLSIVQERVENYAQKTGEGEIFHLTFSLAAETPEVILFQPETNKSGHG